MPGQPARRPARSAEQPQQRIALEDLPSAEDKLALLQCAIERLDAAGYVYIGMDHFALPDDELARAQARGDLHRNFMGYTTHADSDLVGLGVSAISHIGNSFSQNPRDLPSWEIALDEGRLPVFRGMRMDEDDEIRADLVQSLMCPGEVRVRAFQERHGVTDMVVVADAGMLSAGNLNALEEAGFSFIVGSRLTKAPYDLADHFQRAGDAFTDGQILESARVMGTRKPARQLRIVYQSSFNRNKRADRHINLMIAQAERITAG